MVFEADNNNESNYDGFEVNGTDFANHRYKRLIEIGQVKHNTELVFSRGIVRFMHYLGLITFIILLHNGFVLFQHTFYFIQQENLPWYLPLGILIYTIFLFYRVIKHYSSYGLRVFQRELNYWCDFLIRKNLILFLIDSKLFELYLANKLKSYRCQSHFNIQKIFGFVNLNNCFMSYFFSTRSIFRLVSLISMFSPVKYWTENLFRGLFNIANIIVYIPALFLSISIADSYDKTTHIGGESPAEYLIIFILFFALLVSYCFIFNSIIERHARILAIKSILFEAFLRDPNCNATFIEYSSLHEGIIEGEVISIINSYLYPEKKIDDKALSSDGVTRV